MSKLYYPIVILCISFLLCFASNEYTYCQDPSPALDPKYRLSTELVVNPSFEDGRVGWFAMDTAHVFGWSRVQAADELWGACGQWYAKINTLPCYENGGVFNHVFVNQTVAKPLLAQAWTTGNGIIGSYGSDYSLYADVEHQDGTFSWGHFTPFDLNVTLWQYKNLLLDTGKPIKYVYIYGLFRKFQGTAYFDNFSLKEVSIASSNLIANPSMDGSNGVDCSAPIPGWKNVNASSTYITCPAPDTWIVHSLPGFIATPGANGLCGATQRVTLSQTTPKPISFGVYARWTRSTVSGPHVKQNTARIVATFTDGTSVTKDTTVYDTTQVRLYTIDYTPSKPIKFVDVYLLFDAGGYSAIIHWDDAYLVQI